MGQSQNINLGTVSIDMCMVRAPRGGQVNHFRKTSFFNVSKRNYYERTQGGSPGVKRGLWKFNLQFIFADKMPI